MIGLLKEYRVERSDFGVRITEVRFVDTVEMREIGLLGGGVVHVPLLSPDTEERVVYDGSDGEEIERHIRLLKWESEREQARGTV